MNWIVKTERVIMPTLRWEYYILGNILLGGLIGLLIVDPMTALCMDLTALKIFG